MPAAAAAPAVAVAAEPAEEVHQPSLCIYSLEAE